MNIYFNSETSDIVKQSYIFYKRYCKYYDEYQAKNYALFYAIYSNDFDPLSKNIFKIAKIKPTLKNRIRAHTKEKKDILYISEDIYIKEIREKINSTVDCKLIRTKVNDLLISPIELFYLVYEHSFFSSDFFNFSKQSFRNKKKKKNFEKIIENILSNSLEKLSTYENHTLEEEKKNTREQAELKKEKTLVKIANTFGGKVLTDEEFKSNPLVGNEMILKKVKKQLITGNSIALLGESGAGKTTLVKGLAFAIKTNNVPSCLKNKNIISLNTNELLSGTDHRGDLEKKISTLLKIAKETQDTIFFFDEMHTLMSGKCRDDDINFANMLKPALSDKDIQIIGTTTIEEWDQWIANDSAFRERFKTIHVDFPNDEHLTNILLNYKNILESQYDITFDIDKCFFETLVKHTNKKNSKKYYETIKNPRLSLGIIDDIFANAMYEEKDHITKGHIVEAILDNEVLTDDTKEEIIANIPNERKNTQEEKKKIIKLQQK